MFENEDVELWYHKKFDAFFLHFKGNFFEPMWSMTANGRKWIFENPNQPGLRRILKLIDKRFCKINELEVK